MVNYGYCRQCTLPYSVYCIVNDGVDTNIIIHIVLLLSAMQCWALLTRYYCLCFLFLFFIIQTIFDPAARQIIFQNGPLNQTQRAIRYLYEIRIYHNKWMRRGEKNDKTLDFSKHLQLRPNFTSGHYSSLKLDKQVPSVDMEFNFVIGVFSFWAIIIQWSWWKATLLSLCCHGNLDRIED